MQNNQTPAIPGFDLNAMGKLLGGMNLSSLASALNGININQLIPLIPMVTKMFGNASSGPAANPGYQSSNPGIFPQPYGQVQNPGVPSPFLPIPEPYLQDPRFVVLNTMKPLLPPDKIRIVDSIMGILAVILTINSVLPHKPAPVVAPQASSTPAPPVITPSPPTA
ncbi:hypothetical protein [Fonticella tunisiensis]|uniref:Uncharacterized protein n=1 Tax=Fonticella tunisiensis TaxID=1096341 RepID=A0A4V3ETA7_9CLOT|nr:hypothetical protein [Fonticella tunisiensis]TDT58438.1 hypothetical protein EDD71_11186 [Fonticella tunisiensis]